MANDGLEQTRTEGLPASKAQMLRVHAATLDVQSGTDSGRSVRVESPTFVIGSGEGADLQLGDPTVSRAHLGLALTPGGVHVRDAGSRNGTWIGNVRITDAVLTADTVLKLGGTLIALRLDGGPTDLPLSSAASFGDAIGVSAPMRHLFAILERASRSDVTVLLEGESGVGKEILARGIHALSARKKGPLITLDCGAIPAGLVESELFGHERGGFTGATHARQGIFEQADGGTVFLDEIGELPLDLQPKLLRVLEAREVRPVGGRGARPVDVRVVAATNRRLAEAASRNEFRRDLFYRLAVARITVPPLRDRPEDIVPIARALLRRATSNPSAEVPTDLAALLQSYPWPGNVRELRNVIERYALLGARAPGDLFDAAPGKLDAADATLPYNEARRRALSRFERQYVPAVLERAGGVVARAAELAELARPSFYRLLERQRVAVD